MSSAAPILLSPPELSGGERAALERVLASGWLAPAGPELEAFEREIAEATGREFAVALSSGTAGLHLALLLLGVGPGDSVLVPTLTFVASANPVRYCGAEPIFVDCDRASWNIDPNILEEALRDCAHAGRLPAAVISVDLYGQCADYPRIEALCADYGVPLVEDAAEALGATRHGAKAGSFGECAIVSLNGNKIITATGGGALATDSREFAERARYLATQARDPLPYYRHQTIGYNYRMSSLLAAFGRAQLADLSRRVELRRQHYADYVAELEDLPGIDFMPELPGNHCSFWLTCLTVDPATAGVDREQLRLALERERIESRPVWEPMHRQPIYRECQRYGGAVAEELSDRGLCLPSGSALKPADRRRVTDLIRSRVAGATP